MVGIVIATHGDFGKGILNAIELILGKTENIQVLGLHHGDGITVFEKDVVLALESADTGEGVIGFVDILGGTPANIMMKCMQKKQFPCIAGVNMPMLIEAITNREGLTPEVMACKCLKAGSDGFISLHQVFNEMLNTECEDEF